MKMGNGLSGTDVCFVPFVVSVDSDDKRTPAMEGSALRSARVRAFGVSSVESSDGRAAALGSDLGSGYYLSLSSTSDKPRAGSLRVSGRSYDVTPALCVAWVASMLACVVLGYALAL